MNSISTKDKIETDLTVECELDVSIETNSDTMSTNMIPLKIGKKTEATSKSI